MYYRNPQNYEALARDRIEERERIRDKNKFLRATPRAVSLAALIFVVAVIVLIVCFIH